MVSRSRFKAIVTGIALYLMAAMFIGYFGVNAYTGKYGLNAQQELDQEVSALTAELARLQQERRKQEQRISLLDNRILQLESDLAETGRQLSSAPAGLVASSSVGMPFALNPGQVTAISIISVIGITCVAFPIAIAIARKIWRSGLRRDPAAVAPESAQRMERLEQAVDAIAIEIERVSEGQRYVTRLLTEGAAPALPVGQKAADPVRISDREALRASRESA